MRRLEQIEGIWTVMESEMTNALEKTRTELVVETIDYNVGLKESDFSRRELGDGRQAASEPRARRAGSTAGASLCRSSSSSARSSSRRAPTSPHIDNDITAWFSKDDPVYRDYERYQRASSAAPAR